MVRNLSSHKPCNKLLLVGLIVCMGLFLISFASAWTSDNFIKDNLKSIDTTTNYGTYEISESKWWDVLKIFTEEKIKEVKLNKNTDTCSNDCLAEGTIILNKDNFLMEDVLWKRSFDNQDTWVDWNSFVNWKVLVEEDVDIYETTCIDLEPVISKNGTIQTPQECSQIKTGVEKQWNNLDFKKEYKAGSYNYRIEGSKKGSTVLDWIIKTDGKLLDEWAVWGNISLGDEAEVILNSPEDESTSLTSLVTFNASAEVTGGAYLTNATLYDNSTGTWGARNVTEIGDIEGDGLVSYYKLDEASGSTAYDSLGLNNGTTTGTVTVNQDGKINKSYLYAGGKTNATSGVQSATNLTLSLWFNTTNASADMGIACVNIETAKGMCIGMGHTTAGRIAVLENQIAWGANSASSYNDGAWHHAVMTKTGNVWNIYIDGGTSPIATRTSTYSAGTRTTIGDAIGIPFTGYIDEVSIWNRTLTASEITELYNSGAGSRLGVTTTTTTFTNTYPAGSNILWNMQFCDSDGDCGFAPSNYTVYLDAATPSVTLNYPTSLIDYGEINGTLQLNLTVTDTNLDKVWYNYNGTNITITGATSGVANLSNITLSNKKNITIYANDAAGNLNETVFSWDYKVFENSRTYSESTFETKAETFLVNVTTSSTPTAKFIYNGTQITPIVTASGGGYLISKTMDIPIGIGNVDFYFNVTVGGDEIQLGNSTQEINLTFFTPTNATYATQFLNISFKDENSLEPINMTVPFSEFVYYLGSGSVNKTMNFANTSENYNYLFSGTTGGLSLKVLPTVQYRKVDEYPQRIWEPEVQTYNSILTNQVLYSLSSVSGIFVSYQVLTAGESPIESVDVVSTRQVSGTTVQVGAGFTDSSGLITFWMNPDFQHTTTFNKEGFSEYIFSHFPTQTSYTITLGDQTELEVDCGQGILQTVRPSQDFLFRNTEYDFNYTVSSSYWNLTSFQITLIDSEGTVLGTDSSTTSTGGTLTIDDINTTTTSSITMTYLYQVDDEDCDQVVNKRVWITQTTDGTEYSIFQLVEDADTYISAGLFGFDNFGKTLLSFIIIVLMVGGISKRYGIASEGAIMGILFGIVFLLDVGLGFIPSVNIGEITSIEHFFTYITFIMLLGVIIREERR